MKTCAFAICIALFLFILPIPGTIALRNVLLLLGLGLAFSLWREFRLGEMLKETRAGQLIGWMAALSLWLLVQAILISDESAWALHEMASQWLPALLSIPLGFTAVLISRYHGISTQRLLAALVLVFLAQTVFSLLVTVPDYLASGVFPRGKTALTAGKLEISYWNNLLLAFLAVDGLSRWVYRHPITALPRLILVGGILLVFFSNLAFGARNGMIGAVLLIISLATLVLWHERQRLGIGKTLGFVGAAIVLIFLLALGNYRLDSRWERFQETAKIAWQGESDAWLHPDDASFPLLKSGDSVEVSAYTRISWIRAGVDLIKCYPYGIGYGRNAFGHALRKTKETRLGHAHSGLIDWTIGAGLPGLMLWLGFLTALAALGIRRYFRGQDPAGLILTFVVGGFFGRMLLDSINRDHMLMVFFLIISILVALREDHSPQ